MHEAEGEMMSELGITEPMSDSFAARWDKRDDLADSADYGWVGEGPDGIWSKRHPDAVLAQDDGIQDIVTEFRCTTDRQIRRGELELLSAWEVTAWLTMLSAQNRSQLRRVRSKEEDDDGLS